MTSKSVIFVIKSTISKRTVPSSSELPAPLYSAESNWSRLNVLKGKFNLMENLFYENTAALFWYVVMKHFDQVKRAGLALDKVHTNE